MDICEKINAKAYDATAEFKSERAMYDAQTVALRVAFWEDAFEFLDIDPNHPKAELLKETAWNEGHSNGFNDVLYYADILSYFLKD